MSVADDGGLQRPPAVGVRHPSAGGPAPVPGGPRRPRLAVGRRLRVPLHRRRAGGPRPRQPRDRGPGRHHRRLRAGPRRGRPAARRRRPGHPRHPSSRSCSRPSCGRPTATGPTDVEGQVAVGNSGRIAGVSLVPADPGRPQAALDAIAAADQVVIGPGLAVHQRAGGGGRARHPRRAGRHPRPGRSTSATCASRAPRPRATTSPPTSTPSAPTAWRSTSCCAIRAPSPSEESSARVVERPVAAPTARGPRPRPIGGSPL